MSHAATLHPDEKYKAGKTGASVMRLGLAGFAVLTVLSLFFVWQGAHSHYTDEVLASAAKMGPEDAAKVSASGWPRFVYAFLTGWAWILSIALGALLYVLIHHAVKAKWSVTTRRLAEILSMTLPWIFAIGLLGIVIPVLAKGPQIFYWAHPDAHFPSKKTTWFAYWFWTLRYVFYFAIWIAIARFFNNRSRAQDEAPDTAEGKATITKHSDAMRRLSYPMIIVFALSVNYAGYDFLMMTAPKWYSTIYSVNFFGGCMIGAYATISLFAWMLQRSGRLVHSVNAEHYHDTGKMLFAFTFFWTYTAFSQFMLIWYGNMAEETVFYNYRMFASGWQAWSWVVLFCQFAIPFLFLLSRWTKRIMPVFVLFCFWQLAFHWVDLYWNVMPHYHWGAAIHGAALEVTGPLTGPIQDNSVDWNFADVTTWLALVFFFIAAIGKGMKGNLIPVKDPNLGASLAHENY